MTDRIPVQNDWRIVVVVKDVEQAAKDYAEVYGIEKWQILDHTSERMSNMAKDGRSVGFSFKLAMGETPSIRFSLVQPTGGESAFSEFLATHGEGIQCLQTAMIDQDELKKLTNFLASEGVGIGQDLTVDGQVDARMFDTRKQLGGFQVLVLSPKTADSMANITFDGELDFSETERNEGEGPFNTPGCSHFGVVVNELMPSLEAYARLFKVPNWRGMNWRAEPGWLEDPTYLGKPVNHAYFTGSANVGETGLAFEVIQPTFGPSHYKEDFRNIVGEGIHHMNLMPFKVIDEYRSFEKWMKGIGADMVMSGGLRWGAADFWYIDTRTKLHGYVSEVTCPRPTTGERPRFDPDFQYDFSEKLSAQV